MRKDLLPAHAVLASNRLANHVRMTPLDYSPWLSEKTGARVHLKLENLQYTGSFKLRGAFNKLLAMSEDERRSGCVAASSGNHGAAVAFAMSTLGVKGIIFVPENTSSIKVAAIREAAAEVRFFGTDGLDTEMHAREYAAEHGMTYLSPYNDPDVIAGQGSCGVEIARQLAGVDALFVAIGGGGLIAGVGGFLKSVNPGMTVVGCQPEASAVMAHSVDAGRILEMPSLPTLSDGTAGGIESGAITFDLCRAIVDDYVLVTEDAIADAMRSFIDRHHMLAEGAAAVAMAGVLSKARRFANHNVVAIVCGGNVSRETLKKVL